MDSVFNIYVYSSLLSKFFYELQFCRDRVKMQEEITLEGILSCLVPISHTYV